MKITQIYLIIAIVDAMPVANAKHVKLADRKLTV